MTVKHWGQPPDREVLLSKQLKANLSFQDTQGSTCPFEKLAWNSPGSSPHPSILLQPSVPHNTHTFPEQSA